MQGQQNNNGNRRYQRHSYHEDMNRGYSSRGGGRGNYKNEGPRRRQTDDDDTVLDNQDVSSVTSQDQGW